MAYGLIVVYKLIKRFGYCKRLRVTAVLSMFYFLRAPLRKHWRKINRPAVTRGLLVGQ